MIWRAVIVRRPSGVRLFLARDVESGTGLIWLSNSQRWSDGFRPFGGPVLETRQVEGFYGALAYFRGWRKSQAAQ